VEIHVRESVHGSVMEDVRSGVADFGIGYVDELPDFAVGTPLGRETFCVVTSARHKLAGRRKLAERRSTSAAYDEFKDTGIGLMLPAAIFCDALGQR
jgi:DNA-binding transcriptional LysR family regulator